MNSKTNLRRNYKDRLFKFIFGNEEYKEYALSLYNAVNNSNYTDPNDLKFTTIDDVIFMNMKNDVSFMIDSRMNLYEHQSTFSPNMPVRGLMYFGKLYDTYTSQNDINVYGTKQVKLPTPKFVVFYNGERNIEDVNELRLTSAFDYPKESAIEVIARVININQKSGDEILSNCKPLAEYAEFIETISEKRYNGYTHEDAVNAAIDHCIDNHILYDILIKHKSEVSDMFLTEYDEEKTMRLFYQDGVEDGLEQGLEQGEKQGRLSIIKTLLSKNSAEDLIKMGLSAEEVAQAQK